MANLLLTGNSVVVTGIGAFTAAGRKAADLWEAVLAGHSLAGWSAEQGERFGVCRAPDVENTSLELRRLRRMDRCVQFAGAAASAAWSDAGLEGGAPAAERVAVFTGTSRGPLGTILESQARLESGDRILPSLGPNSTISCLSGALSILFGARGPCLTVSAACASGAAAIALAGREILSGAADIALAGGAEAPLNGSVLAQLQSAGVLASGRDPTQACRPFDVARNGTVLGEGAGFLLLESLASAQKRGARLYAILAGWSIASEGGERTGISGDGDCLERTMRGALTMAGISFSDLGYINAHGTGTQLNDRMEAHAIARAAAADGGKSIPVSSTKPVTGHCMGAASAIEAVISVMALQQKCLPPTANCFEQDADCPVELVLGRPRQSAVEFVLSNSAGFWGNNASLVFALPPA